MADKSRYRNWCFTTFKLDIPYEDKVPLQFIVYQTELCPKTKKTHNQGYVEFQQGMTISQVKKWMNDKIVHLEPRRGTQAQAMDYCEKSETRIAGPWRKGIPKEQGHRTDLDELKVSIQNGCTLDNIIDEHFALYLRYGHAIDKLLNRFRSKDIQNWIPVCVKVYWGKPGVGKTRKVFEEAPGLYLAQKNGKWWDGYEGQDAILFDDFEGEVDYTTFLNITDGYRMNLEVKGSFTVKQWTKVYITSNSEPKDWYSYRGDGSKALLRRISEITLISAQK